MSWFPKVFARWAIENVCKVLVEFGKRTHINPHDDPKKFLARMAA